MVHHRCVENNVVENRTHKRKDKDMWCINIDLSDEIRFEMVEINAGLGILQQLNGYFTRNQRNIFNSSKKL